MIDERPEPTPEGSRLPFRLAVASLLAAVPLVVFGGSVTSLDAGMAIDGWWILEPGRGDHFLIFFPLEKWFRDVGTFVEHTHRLFGTVVGLLAIATLVSTFVKRSPRGARWFSVAALLAVCLQGAVGGFRVLENSPELAFLHGAFGQAVFAVLAAQAVVLSPRYRGTRPSSAPVGAGLAGYARASAVSVYVAIVFGAWLRHDGPLMALALHVLAVFAALSAVLILCGRLRACAGSSEFGARDRDLLASLRRRLIALLGGQLLLGLLSFYIVFVAVGPTAREVHQSIFPTLHVLFGALLLAQAVAAAMWTRRLACAPGSRPALLREASLGGAS